MNERTRVDFTGQVVYVGIDVHKKSWSVSIYGEQLEYKTFSMVPDVGTLVKLLKREFPGARYRCVYEAGFSGYWIHDQLWSAGVECLVVNPADIPTKDKERRIKTDRVDCRKQARELRAGSLKGIYVPSRSATEDRWLVRARQGMVRKRTRVKNQIKALVAFYGLSAPADRSWSKRYIQWLEEVHMLRPAGQAALRAYLNELSHWRESIAGLDHEIRALATTDDYLESVRLMRTIPGIGTLAAMTFLTELVDLNRFNSLDALAGYVGLIPDVARSGEKEYVGEMTRRQNSSLRVVLIECAWMAARKDPAMMLAYNTLAQRMPGNKAIIRIARKLLNRIRFVLKNRQPYVTGIVA